MNDDVKLICTDILRDLYGSSRRLAIYPLGHPVTQETLKKPLATLNGIFSFKHSFTVDLFKERVFGEGIVLDDTIFVSGMALEMKRHKLSTITISSDLAIGDLYHFLSMLIARPGPYEDNMARILKAKNIKSVAVNLPSPPRLYSFDKIEFSSGEKFSLEERVKEIISEKPGIITSYYVGKLKSDEDVSLQIGVDFRLSYLARHFKEILLHLDREQGLLLIENALLSTNWLDDSIDSQAILGLRRIFEDCLAENSDQETLSSIFHLLKKVGAPEMILNQFFNKTSLLKLKTFQESEKIVETLRISDPSKVDAAALRKTVFKLAASHQKDFLRGLLAQLIKSLSSEMVVHRQQAAGLLSSAADVLANGGFFDEFSFICKEAVQLSLLPTETSEPVELTADLIWLAVKNNRWQEFKVLTRTLRGICDDRFQNENKRKLAESRLTELSGSDVIFKIASNLSDLSRSDEANEFFEGLSALGSRDIIRMLAGKLTHPDINIRSRMIKLLISMKSNAGDVITEQLAEMIKRVDGGQISDEDWYYFRNALRVIKEVHAEQAIPCLEIITTWPSSKMKLEVIKTLETMPPESAVKLLDKLSSDNDIEVRKAAVVAMGLSSDKIMIPYLREVFMKHSECRHIAVASLGRIGEPQARDILIELFESPDIYKGLGISRKESDEIRVTILKALAAIGDEVSQRKISQYSAKPVERSLFSKDIISSTAKIILGARK